MKSNLFFMFAIILFVSCSNNDKLITENGNYYVTVQHKLNDNESKSIKFSISRNLIDSLETSDADIVEICKQTVEYADWNVKFKPTYQYPEKAFVYFDNEENEYVGSIDGTCENAYGTRDNISTMVVFDKTFKIKKDESGNLKILSF